MKILTTFDPSEPTFEITKDESSDRFKRIYQRNGKEFSVPGQYFFVYSKMIELLEQNGFDIVCLGVDFYRKNRIAFNQGNFSSLESTITEESPSLIIHNDSAVRTYLEDINCQDVSMGSKELEIYRILLENNANIAAADPDYVGEAFWRAQISEANRLIDQMSRVDSTVYGIERYLAEHQMHRTMGIFIQQGNFRTISRKDHASQIAREFVIPMPATMTPQQLVDSDYDATNFVLKPIARENFPCIPIKSKEEIKNAKNCIAQERIIQPEFDGTVGNMWMTMYTMWNPYNGGRAFSGILAVNFNNGTQLLLPLKGHYQPKVCDGAIYSVPPEDYAAIQDVNIPSKLLNKIMDFNGIRRDYSVCDELLQYSQALASEAHGPASSDFMMTQDGEIQYIGDTNPGFTILRCARRTLRPGILREKDCTSLIAAVAAEELVHADRKYNGLHQE